MPAASEILKIHSSEIMNNWESRVREEIPASLISRDRALRKQLPYVLNDIAEIIDEYDDHLALENHKKCPHF